MHLPRFPRVPITRRPTALKPIYRLSATLGGPRICFKRDDFAGLSTGDNKTRKLEIRWPKRMRRRPDSSWRRARHNPTKPAKPPLSRFGLAWIIVFWWKTARGSTIATLSIRARVPRGRLTQ